MRRPLSQPVLAALLALCVLAVFRPAISGGFVWDDHTLIEHAPRRWQRAFTENYWAASDQLRPGVEHDSRLYRPLLTFAIILERRAFGEKPVGYHLVSIGLHLVVCLLVFLWLEKRAGDELAALAGALVFALHPSRAESVAWLSAASDIWAAAVLLLAMLAWERRTAGFTALATALFVAATLFKESAVAVPAALVTDALLLPANRERLRQALLPLGAVAVAFGARMLVVPFRAPPSGFTALGWLERVLGSAGQFFRHLVAPFSPSVQSGFDLSKALGGPHRTSPWMVALGVAAVLLVVLLVARARQKPELRPYLADVAWFLVPALPMLNLVPLGGLYYYGDRFLYLPLLGIAAIVARGFAGFRQRSRPVIAPWLAYGAFGLLLGSWCLVAVPHLRDFRSDLALWESEHLEHPNDPVVVNSVMRATWSAGDFDRASQLAVERLRLFPGPKDKGDSLLRWMDIEEQRENASPEALDRLREDAEALAAGRPPPSQSVRALARQVPPAGLRWLRQSDRFRELRGRLATETGEFARAIAILEAPSLHDAGDLLVALVVAGRCPEALQRFAPRLSPEQLAAVERCVKAAPTTAADEAAAMQVRRALSLRAYLTALPLADRCLERFPNSAAVWLSALNAHIATSHLNRVRTDLTELRQLVPDPARWDGVAQALQLNSGTGR